MASSFVPFTPLEPQRSFHLFNPEDDRTSLGQTDEAVSTHLRSVIAATQRLCAVPRIRRLMAISLMEDVPDGKEDDIDVPVELQERVASLISDMPQVYLVQGLEPEARVVKTADAGGQPQSDRPRRIDLRAERVWFLATIGNRSGTQNPHYRRAFGWMVLVLTHEIMHLVRDRFFQHEWQQQSPPRLKSVNRPQGQTWTGPPPSPSPNALVASTLRSLPTTHSKTKAPPTSRSLPPSPAAIHCVTARKVAQGGSLSWDLDSSDASSAELLGDTIDATTPQWVAILSRIGEQIATHPPTWSPPFAQPSHKEQGPTACPVPRDVFLASEASQSPELARYVAWRDALEFYSQSPYTAKAGFRYLLTPRGSLLVAGETAHPMTTGSPYPPLREGLPRFAISSPYDIDLPPSSLTLR
ncbi:hypothetical protein DFH09DRAFT_1068822 [Mycena vulgaris]|nr:hypothetical protein DFH09DRAFT_1068822 [Mycena vulgaris]